MTAAEERIDKLETRFSTLEQQVATVAAKVDMIIEESQQQREDIRRAREKHDEDIKEMNAKIDSKFDGLSNQIHNLTIAAVVGFGAIAVAVSGLIVTALNK